ncbi:DUF262 domain-containing protein [Erwinia piriflorinigrans]|uniref:DUF262 domain-containing protein n=1 Tax=Erwinia piriflorinigrans CFBP 5888 TaxID=1161919 RepID=V5Z4W7_9GAMM|nr:DUF262 domain-containing protein [Erwinia piriflorinigrans]CCG85988.1 hypothetical protein EPIR_0623 [Erwinia piriflorinigrans CFBP 5888]
MNFDAVQVDLNDILSVNRRYLIPRNQRDFSWERLQLDEFWDDIKRNIRFENGSFNHSEYFLGTVVLSGSTDSSMLEIIDGQQRLSVITIILSIISRNLRDLKYTESADDIVNTYLVSKAAIISAKTHLIEKIKKSNGRDFFKLKCQSKKDMNPLVKSDEDEKINDAYAYFEKRLGKQEACKLLNKSKLGVRYSEDEYIQCLDAIMKMITSYLKVVRILVPSTDDAYDVFEVLNARGISLSSIDLIKNKILQYCSKDTYPEDTAKKLWSSIEDGVIALNSKMSMSDYVRVWWMSNFGYIGTDQLYRSFKKKTSEKDTNLTPESFLFGMERDSVLFFKICDPQEMDWKGLNQKKIYRVLKNLETFNVSIQRPLILALLRVRENKKTARLLQESVMISTLQFIEDFQFKFTTICKMKPSGVDAMFAKYASEIAQAQTKTAMNEILVRMVKAFTDKMPTESVFIERMINHLWYSRTASAKKKRNNTELINYVYHRLESVNRGSDEISLNNTNLEHIGPQSMFDPEYVGMIGNLIPLSVSINDKCGNLSVEKKINLYGESDLNSVADFISYYRSYNRWDKELVVERSKNLAHKLFNNMAK